MEELEKLVPNPPHRPVREEPTPEQERYAFLKASTNLSQRQIAEQLGVHHNTISNWNKSPLVQKLINEQIEIMRKDNMIGMQRLMSKMIEKSLEILDSDIGNTTKVQLIGQLFSQAGKMSALEPPKQVKKQVTVQKSIEQMLNDETDYEVIEVD